VNSDATIHHEPASGRAVGWACQLLILASVALSTARLLEAEPLQSANDRSRWCTVRALVEQGTYRIDDVRELRGWDTIDLVRSEGHFYSTKPPLLPTLVAGLYWCVRQTLGWRFHTELAETTRLILFVVNILPWWASLVALDRIAANWSRRPETRLVITAAASFASLCLPFLMSLNNHTPAAVAVVFALASAARILAGRGRQFDYALVGFFASFAITCELPAAAFAAGMLALVCRNATWSQRALSVVFALVPLAGFFVTNWLATGGPRPFYAGYGSEIYEFVHEGVPSYWMQPRGIDRGTDCFPMYFLHCTIGHHGILSLSPIYLLTVLGWGLGRRRNLASPALHWLGLALTVIVFGFYLTRTAHYNYGGVSVALRWLLWLTPFWLLAMAPVLDRVIDRSSFRWFTGVILAGSMVSAWYPIDGPWKHPWLYTVMEDVGWIHYGEPPPKFDRPVNSWIGRLPEGPLDEDYWVEFAAPVADGSEIHIRLADGGPETVGGNSVRLVDVTRMGETTETFEYAVDAAAFEAGSLPREFLRWPEEGPPDVERVSAAAFWQGLPGPVGYVRAADRYEHTSLRRDAFACRRAYSWVTIDTITPKQPRRYRRDVWFADEIPFGTLRFETQVIGPGPTVLSRQQFDVVAVGRWITPPTPSEE